MLGGEREEESKNRQLFGVKCTSIGVSGGMGTKLREVPEILCLFHGT